MNPFPDASAPSLQLPVELFSVIGGFLAGDLCFASLASLNVTSKTVKAETTPVLYETIFLQWSEDLCTKARGEGRSACSAGEHVRYAIIDDVSAEEPETSAISTFGNTHWLRNAFPQLRIALFRRAKPRATPGAETIIPCHAVVYEPVTLSEIISVTLSITAARMHFADTKNAFLNFGPFARDTDQPPSYVTEEIEFLTLEAEGRIVQDAANHSPADLVVAWADLCFHPMLIISPARSNGDAEAFKQVLRKAVTSVFTPRSKGKCVGDRAGIFDTSEGMYRSVRIECSYTALGGIMDLLGSLDKDDMTLVTVWDEGKGRQVLHAIENSAGDYARARDAYCLTAASDAIHADDRKRDTIYFPELKRYVYRMDRLLLQFPLAVPHGYPHPVVGNAWQDHGHDWWKAKYPDQTFHVIFAYLCSPSLDRGFDRKELVFTFSNVFSVKEESGTAFGLMYREGGDSNGLGELRYERIDAEASST